MEWNTTKKIWQYSTEDHLFALWAPFLGTWPTAATMRNGQVFEQQTPERPTTDLESSLLRSPTASQGEGGALGEEEARKRGNTVGIRDQAMDIARANGAKVTRAEVLPTPIASDWKNGKNSEGFGLNLSQTVKQTLNNLIPTPTTRDHKDGSQPHERNGVTQTDTVARAIFNSGEVLLPTTRTSMANGPTQKELDAGNPKSRIETEVQLLGTVTTATSGRSPEFRKNANPTIQEMVDDAKGKPITNWGKFEPAIRRWEEVLGRPAPAPTKPDGKDGAHRLSSAFTEWMMGLPEGWITDCELSRNDELKACGNGVVPQQAELALRILLEDIPIISCGGGQVNLPTPMVSDTYSDKLRSSQQKEGSMHSVTLPQAVRMIGETDATN